VLALGGGPLALGLTPAISSVTYIVLAQLAGSWSDRFGRYRLTIWGNVCFAGFAVLAYRIPQLPLLMLAMPLLGAGAAMYWPVVQAAIGDLAGPGRLAREVGRFNVSWSAGKALGYLAGGLLLAGFGFRTAFLTGAALVTMSLLFLPRPRALPGELREAHRAPGETIAVSEERRRAFRHMAWLANLAAFGAGGVLNHQLPKWFAELGWHEGRFGVFLCAVFGVQTVVFALLAGRVRFAYSAWRLLLPQLAAGLVMASLPWCRSFGGLLALTPLLGGALGVCYAASIYYSLHTSTGKGRNAGIHESLIGVGNLALPVLGGVAVRLTGRLGAPYPLAAFVILAAVAVQLAWWLSLRRRERAAG